MELAGTRVPDGDVKRIDNPHEDRLEYSRWWYQQQAAGSVRCGGQSMIDLKAILYPTDFSDHALCALPYALELCRRFDAELHCLHVVDEAYQYWLGAGETAVPVVMPLEEIRTTAQKRMETFEAEHLKGACHNVITSVGSGRPFVEIIRYVEQHQIGLVVIATHGHGALASVLLGSVTEKVVRKSPCPVMTIRHSEHKFEMP